MKRYLLITLLICVAFLFGSSGAWAAGYTRTLTDGISVTGYELRQFYDFQNNNPEVLPTSGDLRYRAYGSGGYWGLHNFASGGRSGTATISVKKGDILILQHYSSEIISTINCGALNESLTATKGYQVYDITADADNITFTIARYGGIVAAVVMKEEEGVTKYTYNFNYTYDGNTIKTLTGSVASGTPIILDNPIEVEGTRYYVNDGEALSYTIEAAITKDVPVRKAQTFAFSYNAMYEGNNIATIASGELTEGDSKSIAYNRFYNVDGALVVRADGDGKQIVDKTVKDYAATIKPTSNNFVMTQNYIKAGKENIVFLAEAEDIEGLTPITSRYLPERFSGGKGAYAADEDKVITTLPAGSYKLTAHIMGTQSECTFTFKAGDQTIWENATNSQSFYVGDGITGDAFELTQETNIVLVAGGGDGSSSKVTNAVDFIYIQYLGDKHTYSVKAVSADGKVNETIEGVGYSLDNALTIPYKKYILVGDTLYAAQPIDANGKAYSTTFTLDADKTIDITYEPTGITNVVYFSEGEKIEGAIPTSVGNNMATRSSNAACGYIENDVTLLNLPASNYIATMVCYSNSSSGATQKFDFGEAENYNATITGASNWTSFTKEFSLESAKDIKWISSDASNKNGLDFIYIQDRGEYHRYTVRGKIEELEVYEEIAEGDGYANDPAITIPVKKYIEKLGTLYEAQPIDDNYSITFTLGQNVDEVISYTKTTITNVTMFEECEDFTVEGNWAVRGMGNGNNVTYSQDMIGRLAKNSYAYSSPAYEETNYRVTIKGRNQAGSSAGTLELKLRDAEGNLSATIENLTWKAGENKELTSGVISIPVGSSVVFFNNSADYNSNIEMDYVYFQDRGGKISYKLNAVDKDGKLLQNLSEGYSFENEPIQVVTGYNKYVNVEGTLYEAKPNTDKAYLTEFYLTKDTVVNIVYEPTEINNVVYLSEAEGIANASSYDKANANVRCSNGKGAFFENNQAATSLTPGNYRIVGQVYGGDPEDDTKDWTFTISVGNDTIWSQRTTGSLTEHCDTFTIIEPADVIVNKGGKGVNGKDVALLDYIYIQNLGDENKFQLKAVSEDGAIDSLLATRTGYASDEAKYAYYPKYLEVNDTLYEAQPNEDGTYRVLYTTTANNTQTISYTKTNIGEVVFQSEAEAIEGLTVVNNESCSDGKGAYATEATALTTLEAGDYKLTGAVMGAEGTEFTITAGEENIWTATTDGNAISIDNVFTLAEKTALTIAAAGSNNALIDYLFIQKVEKITPVVTITYSVKAVSEDGAIDSLLAQGTAIQSEDIINVAYPKYIKVDSVLYEAQASRDGGKYCTEITLNESVEATVAYTKTDIEKVVFLTEAEAIEGLTAVDEETCSDGKGAYAAEAVALTSLKAGYYKMAGALRGAEGTEFAVTVGNDTIWAAVTIADETAFAETEFELTEDATLTIAAAGDENALMDYFYIQVAEKQVEPEPEPEPEPDDYIDFTKSEGAKSTDENPEAGIVNDPMTLSGGSQIEAAEESALNLWGNDEDGTELRVAEGMSFYVTPPAGEKALHKIIIKGKALNLKASNGTLTEGEEETPEVEFETPQLLTEESAQARIANTTDVDEDAVNETEDEAEENAEETLVWTGNINKVKFTAEADTRINSIIVESEDADENTETYSEEPEPEPEPAILTEAKELAADADAVAVGKLTDAIAAFEENADEEALAAAVEQFKKDNTDSYIDMTNKVSTAKDKWTGAGGTAGRVTTATGESTPLVELYSSSSEGIKMSQTITGLENGLYRAQVFATSHNARGEDGAALDGTADDVAYVFATSGENTNKSWITASGVTPGFLDGEQTEPVTIEPVEVENGELTIGLALDRAGQTGWHTIQIYSFEKLETAKGAWNVAKNELQEVIDEATAKMETGGENGKEELAEALEIAKAAKESNKLNVDETLEAVATLTAAFNAYTQANLLLAEGIYYAYDAATGKFLSRGADWGTRAVVDDYGTILNVTANSEEQYSLKGIDNNSTYGDDENMYADANGNRSRTFTLTKADGGFTLTNTSTGKFVTVDAENYTVNGNGETGTVWQFLTMAERDAIVAENAQKAEKAVRETAGYAEDEELTMTEKSDTLTFKTGSAWTFTAIRSNSNAATNDNGTEVYQGTGTFTQEVADLKEGLYKVSIQGFYRDGANGDVAANYDKGYNMSYVYLDANGTKIPVKSWGAERTSDTAPNSMAEFAVVAAEGKYVSEGLAYVGSDGLLKLTVNVPAFITFGWFIADNVTYTMIKSNKPGYIVNEVVDGKIVRTTENNTNFGTVKVPYRHFNVVDGKLYSKGATSKEYNYSFTFNEDGQTETISGYSATDIEGVVFLSEGEDIKGLTVNNTGNTAVRSSNSASAYAAEEDVEITKLPAGTYKLTAAIYDSAKNPNSMWYFIAGNDTIAKLNCTAVNYQEKSSEKFTLEAETSIKLAKGGSSTQGIDLVYIQAVEAETPIFSYTVNEVIGETVVRTTEGTDEKGATVKVPFREYNMADGKLYKKGQISKEFNYSFKLNSDAQVENLEYSATSVENVVFLKEGEDIEGLTKINSGNSAIRSSNSAAGYAAEGNVEFVTLPAGIYKLTAGIYDSSKTPDSHWKFLAGEQEIADLNCTVVNIQELTSDEFTLTQETKLYIAQGGSASMGIDFIYIVKTGEAIPDGISILKNAAEKGAVYDMQGRKQTGKLRTGLYIMDGKVISVK